MDVWVGDGGLLGCDLHGCDEIGGWVRWWLVRGCRRSRHNLVMHRDVVFETKRHEMEYVRWRKWERQEMIEESANVSFARGRRDQRLLSSRLPSMCTTPVLFLRFRAQLETEKRADVLILPVLNIATTWTNV